VLGLYLLVCLVLIFVEYGIPESLGLLPRSVRKHDQAKLIRVMWWNWGVIFAYVVPTALYARYALGLSAKDLGVTLLGLRKHLLIAGLVLLVVLPCVGVASTTESFQKAYPFYRRAGESWSSLMLWEGSYACQFFAVEFLFRGVLLFGAVRVLGPWAIPAMVVPYMMIHFGKPFPECVGAIFAGSALGLLALRTRSLSSGVLVHVTVALSMDLLALFHDGQLAELLGWSLD